MQGLIELKLGNITMEKNKRNILDSLRYVDYIKEKMVKRNVFQVGTNIL